MALFDSGAPVANVALSDTFNTWRVTTNKINTQAAGLASNNTFTGSLNTFNNTAAFKGPVTAPVVTANTLAGTISTASQTNITGVGALTSGSIASGFGSIDIGANNIDGGTITAATGFSGPGGSITGMSATQLTSGTIPVARVSGSYTSITGTGALNAGSITSGFGSINIGSSTFTGNGSGLTTLNGSNISSGTVPDARLPASISSDITGTAAIATTVTLVATNTTDATHYPVFVDAATGNENPRTDTGFTYNPNSGTLAATDFNATSDLAYKDNVEDISNPLDILSNLSGKMFNWKHTGKKSYGVIAQEVEKILPDVVTENENGKAVNYNTLIAILIESNKQLADKVKRLEEKL